MDIRRIYSSWKKGVTVESKFSKRIKLTFLISFFALCELMENLVKPICQMRLFDSCLNKILIKQLLYFGFFYWWVSFLSLLAWCFTMPSNIKKRSIHRARFLLFTLFIMRPNIKRFIHLLENCFIFLIIKLISKRIKLLILIILYQMIIIHLIMLVVF